MRLRIGVRAATLADSGIASPGGLHCPDGDDLACPGNLLATTVSTLRPWPPARPPCWARLDTEALAPRPPVGRRPVIGEALWAGRPGGDHGLDSEATARTGSGDGRTVEPRNYKSTA